MIYIQSINNVHWKNNHEFPAKRKVPGSRLIPSYTPMQQRARTANLRNMRRETRKEKGKNREYE